MSEDDVRWIKEIASYVQQEDHDAAYMSPSRRKQLEKARGDYQSREISILLQFKIDSLKAAKRNRKNPSKSVATRSQLALPARAHRVVIPGLAKAGGDGLTTCLLSVGAGALGVFTVLTLASPLAIPGAMWALAAMPGIAGGLNYVLSPWPMLKEGIETWAIEEAMNYLRLEYGGRVKFPLVAIDQVARRLYDDALASLTEEQRKDVTRRHKVTIEVPLARAPANGERPEPRPKSCDELHSLIAQATADGSLDDVLSNVDPGILQEYREWEDRESTRLVYRGFHRARLVFEKGVLRHEPYFQPGETAVWMSAVDNALELS